MRHMQPPSLVALFLVLPVLACGPASNNPDGSGEDSSGAQTAMTDTGPSTVPGVTTTAADSGTTAAPGTSSDGGEETEDPPLFDLGEIPDMPKEPPPKLPDFNCATIPDTFVSFELVPGARGYHGLAITPDGLAIGSDGSSLIESTRDGMWGVFIPGIGSGQQMDWLADGDLAHATSDGAITRIRLDGTTEVIQFGANAYGVTVGPDDQIYTTGSFGGNISRIDPMTGDSEVLVAGGGVDVHSLGFSPDGSRLYVGTIGNGTVYYVDLDDDMEPTTGLEVFATQVGNGNGWHDAVGVDLCGYIYVPDYYSRNLYRVSPGGDVVLFWDPANQGHYAHGLAWGTGEHDWNEEALYFPQPYNSNNVGEVVVGVPPRDWPAIPINLPPSL